MPLSTRAIPAPAWYSPSPARTPIAHLVALSPPASLRALIIIPFPSLQANFTPWFWAPTASCPARKIQEAYLVQQGIWCFRESISRDFVTHIGWWQAGADNCGQNQLKHLSGWYHPLGSYFTYYHTYLSCMHTNPLNLAYMHTDYLKLV